MTLQTCEYGSKRMNVMKKRERDRKREGERRDASRKAGKRKTLFNCWKPTLGPNT